MGLKEMFKALVGKQDNTTTEPLCIKNEIIKDQYRFSPLHCSYFSKEVFYQMTADPNLPGSVREIYMDLKNNIRIFEENGLTSVVVYNRLRQTLEVTSLENLQGSFYQ
mgnify:CR=1 FL=1